MAVHRAVLRQLVLTEANKSDKVSSGADAHICLPLEALDLCLLLDIPCSEEGSEDAENLGPSDLEEKLLSALSGGSQGPYMTAASKMRKAADSKRKRSSVKGDEKSGSHEAVKDHDWASLLLGLPLMALAGKSTPASS